jgi:hypothetical protein
MHRTYRYTAIGLLCLILAACQSGGEQSGAPTGDQRPMVGVHNLALNEGVSDKQFDAFVTGPFAKLWREPIGGVQARIERANRGKGKGQYVLVWAFDSVERRNSYFPNPTTVTPAFRENVGSQIAEVQATQEKMCRSTGFTDYVVLFATDPVEGLTDPSLYGVHEFVLKPGVSEKKFEAFVTGPYAAVWRKPIAGLGRAVTKGERGMETGKYKLIYRFSPASLRDRYFPSTRNVSKEYAEQVRPLLPTKLEEQLRKMIIRQGFTDFAPIAR